MLAVILVYSSSLVSAVWPTQWYGSNCSGLQLLLGSNAPMPPDLAATSRTFTPEVAQALAPMKLTSPQDILAGFTLADDDLRASLGPGLVISDDHPYNEYFRLPRVRNLWQWLERQPFALTASP